MTEPLLIDYCPEHGWLRAHDGHPVYGHEPRGYCPYGDHPCGVFTAALTPATAYPPGAADTLVSQVTA